MSPLNTKLSAHLQELHEVIDAKSEQIALDRKEVEALRRLIAAQDA